MVVLSDQSLRLQPDILNRVLLGIIGCKPNTGDFPARFIQSLIHRGEIFLDRKRSMVTGSIPDQGNTTLGTLLKEVFEKGNRAVGIALLEGLNQTLLIIEVDGSIVCLPIPLVEDGHFNPL